MDTTAGSQANNSALIGPRKSQATCRLLDGISNQQIITTLIILAIFLVLMGLYVLYEHKVKKRPLDEISLAEAFLSAFSVGAMAYVFTMLVLILTW